MSDENRGKSGSNQRKDVSVTPPGAFSNILTGTASTLAIERVGKFVDGFRVNPVATDEALAFIKTLKPHDIGLIRQEKMTPKAAGYDGSLNDDVFVSLAGMVWDEHQKATDQQHAVELVNTSGRNQFLTHLLAAVTGFVTALLVR